MGKGTLACAVLMHPGMKPVAIRPSWLLAIPTLLVVLSLAVAADASRTPSAGAGSSGAGSLAAAGLFVLSLAGFGDGSRKRPELAGWGALRSRRRG